VSAVTVKEFSTVRGPSAASRVGYAVAILVNTGLLYAADNILRWNVPFITGDWVDILWAVRLSLVAGIMANAMYIVYDADWFRHLTGIVTGALALLSMAVTYTVFPFHLPSEFIAEVMRLGMLAAMLGLTIAIIAGLVHLLLGQREA